MKFRPLVWIAAAFVSGTFAAAQGWLEGFFVPLVVAAGGLMASVAVRRYAIAGLCVALFAAAALHWNTRHLGAPGDSLSDLAAALPENTRYVIEGRIRHTDILLPGDDYAQLLLDAERVRILGRDYAGAIDGGILVRWSEPDEVFFPGDRVRLEAPIELDLGRVNPDTPSYEDYLRRHGIHSAMRVRGGRPIERIEIASVWLPLTAAARFRNHLAERLTTAIPADAMPFVLTVWLGDRRRIDSAEYESYLSSGAAHILAVSGVHTGIVYMSILIMMRLAFGQRQSRTRCVVAMAAVFAFALLAGARVPSVRAATMIALYLAAELFGREPDAPTALSIAALGFIGIDPDILFDTGFQLSFLSVASILLYANRFETVLEPLPWFLRRGLSTSVAVQILPLPIALGAFGIFPLAAPLLNLAIIPLLGVVLWLAFLTSLLTLLHIPFDAIFGYALSVPAEAIEWLTHLTARVQPLRLDVTAPTPVAVVAYAIAAGCLFVALNADSRQRFWALATGVAAMVCIAAWTPRDLPAEVVFLDVGHGDATFVRSPGGTTMLIDAGDRSEYGDVGRQHVAPFLRANQVTHLDYVLITHDDRDHVGGMAYILSRFSVGEVLVNPHQTDSELENEIEEICRARGIPMRTVQRGDNLSVEGARAVVLHPRAERTSSDNDNSIVVRVAWPGMSALLTGDIEAEGERRVSETDCRAEILKAPHHGSLTSSSLLLIASVSPHYAVVSTGRRRGGKVIRDAVLDRYEEAGIPVLRTDYDGGIRARVRNGLIELDSARAMRGYVHR